MKKTFIASFIACSLLFAGCTAAATKTALDTQKRVNTIQETVYSNQAKSLKVLLYKNLVVQLERDGQALLNEKQKATLNQAWNDRDTIEWWSIQNERAKALRLVGVDSVLYDSQGIIDLMFKSLEEKWIDTKAGIAAVAGDAVGAKAGEIVANPPK
jgi:hypothetical protein